MKKLVSGKSKKSKADPIRFVRQPGDSMDVLLKKAFECGKNLHPESKLAKWIDAAPRNEYFQLVDAYTEGRRESEFSEAWG